MGCIVEGCSNRDIAKQFGLSEETVKRHLSNIFDKTGVSTRLELALFAIAHHLVTPSSRPASAAPRAAISSGLISLTPKNLHRREKDSSLPVNRGREPLRIQA